MFLKEEMEVVASLDRGGADTKTLSMRYQQIMARILGNWDVCEWAGWEVPKKTAVLRVGKGTKSMSVRATPGCRPSLVSFFKSSLLLFTRLPK